MKVYYIFFVITLSILCAGLGVSCSGDDAEHESDGPTMTPTLPPQATPTPTPSSSDLVEAGAVRIDYFVVEPDFGYYGDWFTFSWKTTNASQVEIDPPLSENMPLSGQIEAQVWYDCSFTLTAYGYHGPQQEKLFVNILSSGFVKSYSLPDQHMYGYAASEYVDGIHINALNYDNDYSFYLSTIKTDGEGSVHWAKRSILTSTMEDCGGTIYPLSDGSFIFGGGCCHGTPPDQYWRGYVIKFDTQGQSVWRKSIGSEGCPTVVSSVLQTDDNGIMAAGTYYGTMFFSKFNQSGTGLWWAEFTIPPPSIAGVIIVRQTADGGYVSVGELSITNHSYSFVIHLDHDLNFLWGKYVERRTRLLVRDVIQTRDLGFICVGHFRSSDDTNLREALIIKFDPEGGLQWLRTYKASGSSLSLQAVLETDDGGYLASGNAVLKFNQSGQLEWAKTMMLDTYRFSKIHGADGTYLISGLFYSAENPEALLLRIDQFGNIDDCPYWQNITLVPGDGVSISEIPSIQVSLYPGDFFHDGSVQPSETIQIRETTICPE